MEEGEVGSGPLGQGSPSTGMTLQPRVGTVSTRRRGKNGGGDDEGSAWGDIF